MNVEVKSITGASPADRTERRPNFDRVFPRLEREIVGGRRPDLCSQVLKREDIWKNVEPERQLKWARLAQMAGDVETALAVFAHINGETPELKAAWEDRLDLLTILDRREQLAAVIEASRKVFGEEQYREWVRTCAPQKGSSDGVMDAATAPFERLKQRQDLIQHYMALFSGREDCFARQWVDKTQGKQGYVPVRRPLEPRDVEDHLSGRKTYGIYLVRYDGTVTLAVMDADLKQEFRGRKLKADELALVRREGAYLYSRIADLSKALGLEPLPEFSGGKGLHFWFLLESPVAPAIVKRALEEIRDTLVRDLKAFNLELFPKQDQLSGKGLGNLVKLPLGVHRLTGKRSYLVACQDRSVEAQLEFLSRVEPSGVDTLLHSAERGKQEKVLSHPRLRKWSGDFPELSTLEACCPPLGQIIASCRQGRAISTTEERVLLQTIGFLKRAKTLVHHLMALLHEYNPHLVDFKLSRLRGSPLGCKRIHSILGFTGDLCIFREKGDYEHPLLHLEEAKDGLPVKSERAENLASAIDNLKSAIIQVQRFLG